MRILLDTHVVIALYRAELQEKFPTFAAVLAQTDADASVSAASLWEIAIKTRLGKLNPKIPLPLLPELIGRFGVAILEVTARHAVSSVDPDQETKDPFDRILLAQCAVENLALMTFDGALKGHPLALQI